MEKNTLKLALSLILLFFVSVPMLTSSLLDSEQERKNEENYQRILEEQSAQKEAEEKIYLMGKFDPAQRDDFILIPAQYIVDGSKMYLRKETLGAFLKMQEAAENDEIGIKIASATRSFDYQKGIWNNKWSGITIVDGQNLAKSVPDQSERFKKILEYSAAPGTSRHHWGTDIDINDATPEYFEGEKGGEIYEWLAKNAWAYGFCQPYNQKGNERQTGYNEEKWHWSYLPIAGTLTEDYKSLVKDEDINGFLGDEYAVGQNLINNYVLAINSACFSQ